MKYPVYFSTQAFYGRAGDILVHTVEGKFNSMAIYRTQKLVSTIQNQSVASIETMVKNSWLEEIKETPSKEKPAPLSLSKTPIKEENKKENTETFVVKEKVDFIKLGKTRISEKVKELYNLDFDTNLLTKKDMLKILAEKDII